MLQRTAGPTGFTVSAGEAVDRAHRSAARACGVLVFMIVKRRISRESLADALGLLEEACADIREVLTAPRGGGRVEVPPSADHHDKE